MGHICQYFDNFEIEENYDWDGNPVKMLVRVVTAYWKDKSLPVYKQYYNGYKILGYDYEQRDNLWLSGLGGWLVSFPDETRYSNKQCGYYGMANPDDQWYPCARIEAMQYSFTGNGTGNLNIYAMTDEEKHWIGEEFPELKYLVKKFKHNERALFMDIAIQYSKHPEIEGLVELGLYNIALNNSLFKLTDKSRKAVIKWILDHKDFVLEHRNIRLRDIQRVIKYKMTTDELIEYNRSCYDNLKVDEWRYLQKIVPDVKSQKFYSIVGFYQDYIKMVNDVGHKLDKYWKFPSDLYKAHAKIMEEQKNLIETASALKGEYLKCVCGKMAKKYDAVVDGYKIFIPTDIEVIKKQCDDLYQCLLRNGYVNKVLMQEELLVFIWKDDKPIATVEVFYDKKVGQFYADESGHRRGESCLPTKEVENAFYKWFETFKPIKAKAERKNHYYKGFYSVEDGVFTGFKNFKFEVGKTYETKFSDDEIVKAGAGGCNASEKVFHFCESISEISKHYQPKVYCEVKPLGPVLNYNGALLSNRIQIVRAIPAKEVEKLLKSEVGKL